MSFSYPFSFKKVAIVSHMHELSSLSSTTSDIVQYSYKSLRLIQAEPVYT